MDKYLEVVRVVGIIAAAAGLEVGEVLQLRRKVQHIEYHLLLARENKRAIGG